LTFGENVAVIGLGLVGLLTAQVLRASGFDVLGVDIDSWSVKLAREVAIQWTAVSGKDDVRRIALAFS